MRKSHFKQVFVFVFLVGVVGTGFHLGHSLFDFLRRIQGSGLWMQTAHALDGKAALARFLLADQKSGEDSKAAVSAKVQYEWLELFNRILHFVKNNYVEEIDDKRYQDLIQGAIQGMLEKLDPHSNFLPKEVFNDMKMETSGKFGGLGIEIGMRDSVLTISTPIEDTPAWKAGLKPNDRIVKINAESTKGMNLVEAVSKMRGKPGTDVTLTIYREGFEQFRDIRITRAIIKIQAVKPEWLEPGYAYIRLTTFNESAAQDMQKTLTEMQKKENLRGLVFDLRYNPGGLLDQAVEVASLFEDEGKVVSMLGRHPEQKEVKYARKGQARKDFPIAILVGPSTASAAEIVAGFLQDRRRGIVLGQPTFGKGSVQIVTPIAPEMGLKLTSFEYRVGENEKRIQGEGVVPDLLLEDFDVELLAKAKKTSETFLRETNLHRHLGSADSDATTGKEKEKSQEKRSDFKKEELQLLKGKKKDRGDASEKDKSGEKEDEMAPIRFNPKEDYQVKQAVMVLKSYGVLKALQPIVSGR